MESICIENSSITVNTNHWILFSNLVSVSESPSSIWIVAEVSSWWVLQNTLETLKLFEYFIVPDSVFMWYSYFRKSRVNRILLACDLDRLHK